MSSAETITSMLRVNDTQTLWVIFCHLPEKGRKWEETQLDERKECNREGWGKKNKKTNNSAETEEIITYLLTPPDLMDLYHHPSTQNYHKELTK